MAENLIATKLADKLIDAMMHLLIQKIPQHSSRLHPTALLAKSIEYSKLKTPLNSSPKKTGLSEQQKPGASAPSPINHPLRDCIINHFTHWYI